MSHENVEIVRRSISAYNRRDLDALRGMNDPDVQMDWSASRGLEAGVHQGVEEVMRFHGDFFETFERVDLEAERFIESGDVVVVPNTAHIQGRDGIETIARSTLVFEVRGGLIVRVSLYQETHEALEALELSE